MTTFQPPRATRIEHIGVDDALRCRVCGRVLEGSHTKTRLCRDDQLGEQSVKSHSISLSLDEIAVVLASFAKNPPTARECKPWPKRRRKGASAD